MNQLLKSLLGIVVTLVVGNSLLAWHLLYIADQEGKERMAMLRQDKEDEIIAEVRGRVETACYMIRHIAEKTPDSSAAQESAMETVGGIRFGQNNYLWIHRLDPNHPKSAFMLVHPADALRGRDNTGLIDLDRITHLYYEGEIVPKMDPRVEYVKPIDLFAEFNRIALSQGEGIVSYYWPKITDGKASPEGYRKVAYIKYLPEWHWVVGAGAYADHIDLAMKQRTESLKQGHTSLVWQVSSAITGFSIFIVIIVSVLSWRVTRRQIRALERQVEERRRAEAGLRESEAKFRNIAEQLIDTIYILDLEGRITYVSPGSTQIFGWLPGEMIGHNFVEFLPESEKKRVFAKFQEGVEQGGALYGFEVTFKRNDGTLFDAELTSTLMQKDGVMVGAMGVIRDVTERKQALEELRQREETFRVLAENSADVIMRFDKEGRHLYVNPAVTQDTGLLPEAFLGKTHTEMGFPESLCAVWETAIHGVFCSGHIKQIEFQLPNGTWMDWLLMPELSKEGSVSAVITSGRDISERKRLEEQLRQSQKMESIGRLAGGVAHDFNNLLAVILGYGEMLETELADNPRLREEIQQINAAGERAKELTHQLLAFSRKQVLEMKTVPVNTLLADLEKMLHRLLGEDIHMKILPNPSPAYVCADPVQLEQVFMNLCVNARDAMPNGGALTLEAAAVELDETYVITHPNVQPGPYVVFSVSDTGCGMDADMQRRIFDPFFTTKEQGKGTGLGLSMVYGIVKQHGGEIRVYSEPGHGTTFKIYLPEIQSDESGPASQKRGKVLQGNGEVILVLEDEESVRKLACRLLAKLGYTVIEAQNAQEGIEQARTAERIDLLLTDIIMPDMNGRQVSEMVRSLRPEMKVIFMSGYNEDIIAHHGLLDEGIHFINKPYNTVDLSRKVREVLEG